MQSLADLKQSCEKKWFSSYKTNSAQTSFFFSLAIRESEM